MARRLFAVLLTRRYCFIFVSGSAFLWMLGSVPTGFAQATPSLSFGNNYFVTGDYVVSGVGLRGLGVNGLATGQFTMPDANSVPAAGVPPGADIVAAVLIWETVESSQTALAGQNGFFRPVFSGGPATGYPITGAALGNPNAPVSWSSGGCSGSSQGSKTMRVYSADVRPYLPVNPQTGYIAANGTYEVSLADSGSNGNGAPLTLGATLIIVYRALTSSLPLNSVVIYDGAFAPSNGSTTMSQTLQGFYQAAANPISKLTHIVGNGQSNKFETVSLDGVNLPSLYGNLPSFPGYYNGSWDNPTWSFSGSGSPVKAGDASATTTVVPNSSNGGCVSWGAMVMSTTVQNSDNDGVLDVWKQNQGYCDASVNGGVCATTDPSWVSLPGATSGEKDLFVQLDYMCSIVSANGTCDTTDGYWFYPSANSLSMIANAFAPHGIITHFITGNSGYVAPYGTGAIQEQTCTDSSTALCPYPNQPGIVGWKSGFESYKNQPLNYTDETSCEAAANGPCIRRFQHGRKDSYHYALFAHALGLAEWALNGGSLVSIVASGNTVTFTTSTPHGLNAGTDRVTIADAITNPSLNGTYLVQSASGNVFTIQIPTAANATYTVSTDPSLTVASGQILTTSGVSDIGGADSLITLGLWGTAGQTDPVEAGTFMHELGHSNGLTHGGLYYDSLNSYVPTLEPNCKPNYQSIMNYNFQVDLLDDATLDYSEQQLSTLNEDSLPAGVTTTDNSPLAYSSTKWYTPTQPGGVGSPATAHCDGTPISRNDPNPTMYHVEGPADPITPEWENGSDVNFDGIIEMTLRGYNDWANIDLRQIGATGSDIFGSGISFKGGTGISFKGGTGIGFGTATGISFKGGTGIGNGELSFKTANSYVRPPRKLTAAQTSPLPSIQLTWNAPTFGQIASYNIYRLTNGATAVSIGSVPGTSFTFTDTNVTCGTTYSYFVTAVLANTNPPQESVPSNTTSATPVCAPTSTTVTSSAAPSLYGESVTFTATVTNTAGAGVSTATPTGTVQFSIDGAAFGGPVTLSGSGPTATAMATSSAIATLSVGSPHTITAVYTNTNGNFSGSSGTMSQLVQDFSISASPSTQTIPSGHQAVYTITVNPISGLTGTIALSCSGAPTNSTCSVSPATANLQGAAVSSTVTLSPSKNVDHGTFTLTFTGAVAGGSHSTSVQLTVQ